MAKMFCHTTTTVTMETVKTTRKQLQDAAICCTQQEEHVEIFQLSVLPTLSDDWNTRAALWCQQAIPKLQQNAIMLDGLLEQLDEGKIVDIHQIPPTPVEYNRLLAFEIYREKLNSPLYRGLSDVWRRIIQTYEVAEELWTPTVFPPIGDTFNSIRAVGCADPANIRVIILGQDPYPTRGNAHGLAFSYLSPPAKKEVLPASLRNIYKELTEDLCIPPPVSGNLQGWADQGVLLLNDILTVEEGKPLSHADRGWQAVTDEIVVTVLTASPHVVLVAWGKNAQNKLRSSEIADLITERGHTVLRAPHPSPLSAHTGFFGSKPFTKINADLVKHGVSPIRWV